MASTTFGLLQNYPNPFNSSTAIEFIIPEEARVLLEIYNLWGQKVKVLVDSRLVRGKYRVVWDGKDSERRDLASGVYFYKLITDNFTKVRKMLLIK